MYFSSSRQFMNLFMLSCLMLVGANAMARPSTTDTGGETVAETPFTLAEMVRLTEQMSQAARGLTDYQCLFHKTEWKNSKPIPYQLTQQKWRAKPFSVYMKWIGKEKTDQEVIYREGWNDNKLRAHTGSFPKVTVNLDPEGTMALADSRHSVRKAGFAETMRQISKDVDRAVKEKGVGWAFHSQGESMVYGEKVHCVVAQSPGGPQYYGDKVRICKSLKTSLPIVIQVWKQEQGTLRQIENFGYEACKLNMGLTDKDFDPANPDYHF